MMVSITYEELTLCTNRLTKFSLSLPTKNWISPKDECSISSVQTAPPARDFEMEGGRSFTFDEATGLAMSRAPRGDEGFVEGSRSTSYNDLKLRHRSRRKGAISDGSRKL